MSDNRKVWLNGNLIPWDQANVHVLSHGFSRGAVVFEVFGIHNTKSGPAAFRLELHLKRLRRTVDLLGMKLALSDDEIRLAVAQTARVNNVVNGYIKIMAYYGEEAFTTLVPDVNLDVSILAIPAGTDLGLDLGKTMSACLCKWNKLHPGTVPIEAKVSAHYLNGFLARQEAVTRGFDIGIMMDTAGFVAEGSIEAVFMVKDGVVITAPVGRVLASISRQSVLDIAGAQGIKVKEIDYRKKQLLEADEVFVSATPYKVQAIGRIEDRVYGDAPGPVAQKISHLLEDVYAGRDKRFEHWMEVLD
jgi:branched-chain amino acid aminotransferase